jgi:hypothetical protein
VNSAGSLIGTQVIVVGLVRMRGAWTPAASFAQRRSCTAEREEHAARKADKLHRLTASTRGC